jgi:hypothetical protein
MTKVKPSTIDLTGYKDSGSNTLIYSNDSRLTDNRNPNSLSSSPRPSNDPAATSYGNGSNVAVIKVNDAGQVTSVSTVAISFPTTVSQANTLLGITTQGQSAVGYVGATITGDINKIVQTDNNGAITASGDVTAYSDARLKENVVTVENALDKTLNLRGVYYTRIGDVQKKQKIGVIAQEVEKILPEVVYKLDKEEEDSILTVNYGNITALLIEAIKEQQKQIEELKETVSGLNSK